MSVIMHTLRLSGLCALLLTSPIAAKSPKEQVILPANSALDSEGNPIAIPHQHQSALEFSSPKSSQQRSAPKKSHNKSNKKKPKPLSRKQQLASRRKVADDPNCRWLDQRMTQLEKSLKKKRRHQFGYQGQELKARKQEWICMKCGAEGPTQADHHKCQYRR